MKDYLPQDSGENSLWGDSAIPFQETRPLDTSLQADVLIVGAGYTGLSTALHLAEQGVSVVLLESRCVGYGGSGRNAGLVNAGVWKTPDYVVEQLGEEAGQRFNQALFDSPNLVFDLIDKYKIDCQVKRSGTINVAHKASAMAYLQDRCQQMLRLGASVRLIDGDTARQLSGSPRYCHGGILDPNAGTIHPLSYARGLAQAATGLGVQVFEASPLSSLETDDQGWLAKTAKGQVCARKVVLATNAYSDEASQQVKESTIPVFIFHCASNPLPAGIADSILPERHGIWDTQALLTSSRIDQAGRLIMSSAGSLHGMTGSIRRNWMQRLRDRLYPQTRGIDWTYHWTGQVGMTSNKLLRVQLLAPGLFAPSGFNGRGIGPGTVIGKQLAATLISGNRNEFPFPVEALYREKWRKPRAMFYEYSALGLQLVSKRL